MNKTYQWISVRDAMASVRCSRRDLDRMSDAGKITARTAGKVTEYRLDTLPPDAQNRYWQLYTPSTDNSAADAEIYANAPEYARRKADKYIRLINASGDLSGRELRAFIVRWNADNPDFTTSYPRLLDARKKYRSDGVASLLGKWGKRSGATNVPDDLFAYFKALYLSQGRPSIVSCWKATLGYAVQHGIDPAFVPAHAAFARRIKKELPEQAVYIAREGESAANRKYGFYIRRNYNDILSGECWISDHAQIDIACTFTDRGKTKVGFPWVTAWRDFKSGLWTGWNFHMDSPNSDHIYLSFYRGASKHGIPRVLYLDNGKDYRCRDFAGGRRTHRIDVNEAEMTSLTGALKIQTIFAWPYNAQAKAIERDFLRVKEWFSKHNPGYRGGNVVERPEGLESAIKRGKILSFEEVSELLDVFIDDIMMQSIVSGNGHRAGMAPIDLWNREYPESLETKKVRKISRNALKLFCTRTSGTITIGRRGIRDTQLGVDYYDSWMEGMRGRKVYIRRDIQAMQEAWVFDADTHAYINNAYILPEVSALADLQDDISKSDLKQAIAIKRNSNKLLKLLAKPDFEVPFNEKIGAIATATRALREMDGLRAGEEITDVEGPILLTDMDRVLQERENRRKDGLMDLSFITDQINDQIDKHRELRVFEIDDFPEAVNQ